MESTRVDQPSESVDSGKLSTLPIFYVEYFFNDDRKAIDGPGISVYCGFLERYSGHLEARIFRVDEYTPELVICKARDGTTWTEPMAEWEELFCERESGYCWGKGEPVAKVKFVCVNGLDEGRLSDAAKAATGPIFANLINEQRRKEMDDSIASE